MAVGDAVLAGADKADDATTDIQPGSGVEWLIHTLIAEEGQAFEVWMTPNGGSNFYLIDTIAGGSVHGLTHRLSNTVYLQMKNVSGGTAYNAYAGVITK